MTPQDLAKSGTESGQQRAVFCWSNLPIQRDRCPALKWMYSVPNGGARSGSQAATMKAEGVKSGVSDICLPFARKGYHGFYIEMKTKGGKESPMQKEFAEHLAAEGYLYRCCYDWVEATSSIDWYIS